MIKLPHEELRYNRLKHSFDAINYWFHEEIDVIANDYIKFKQRIIIFWWNSGTIGLFQPKYNLHIIIHNGFADVQLKKIK
jgi:putative hydrolase of the HAD superfamily